MKTLTTVIAAIAILTCIGCGTLSKPFFRPILGTNAVPKRVEVVTALATNLVPVMTMNAAGAPYIIITTNVVQTVTPVFYPATFTVVTNGWEQRPGIDTGIQIAAGATNIFAPGIGSIGGYVLAGVLGVWLTFLNRKASTATETATGLVKGVEDFRKAVLLTPLGAKVSDHLIDQIKANIPAATQAGLLLEKIVAEHTGETRAQAEFVKSVA